jgi:cell division protein FtsQ
VSRTIKRGTPPKRPAPRRRQPAKKVPVMDRLVARLPVSEQTLRRVVTWTITGAAGIGVVVAAESVV